MPVFIYKLRISLYLKESICVYAEFQDILNPVTVSVKINPSQPNYLSIFPMTELASSTSDKTWKNLFWHVMGAKVNYGHDFKLNIPIH